MKGITQKMKKIFEKFKKKAQELFCWLFCSEVLDAINAGCSYEEVETVAQTCVERNFGRRKKWVAKGDT